ncbi:MAG: hypothetical protein PHF44_03375 [Candidatus Pacebacteria bacterium]|nr:hypothetical protein [Candidatus Paceibacterota bacterium]
MKWQDRLRNLSGSEERIQQKIQQEQEEERKRKYEEERRKNNKNKFENLLRELSPRIENVCVIFAKSTKWKWSRSVDQREFRFTFTVDRRDGGFFADYTYVVFINVIVSTEADKIFVEKGYYIDPPRKVEDYGENSSREVHSVIPISEFNEEKLTDALIEAYKEHIKGCF